jgi:dTDP-4-dehydrorhamnose 3,5-epimerase
MKVEPLAMGLLLVRRDVFRDERGSFTEAWRETDLQELGVTSPFVQDNIARSQKGVIRGLHYQYPHDQAKLISVACGEIFDVAVDVRRGSPTFGRHAFVHLTGEEPAQLFIPAGFAHGYAVLSESAVVTYKCSDFHYAELGRTIHYSDEQLNIPWPVSAPIISARDRAAPRLHEVTRDSLPSYATMSPG